MPIMHEEKCKTQSSPKRGRWDDKMRTGHQSEREARSRRETKRKYEGGRFSQSKAHASRPRKGDEKIYKYCANTSMRKKIIEHKKNSARSTRLIILIAHGGRKLKDGEC